MPAEPPAQAPAQAQAPAHHPEPLPDGTNTILAIAEPPAWTQMRAKHPQLASLDWPTARTPADLGSRLTAALARSASPGAWQALAITGQRVKGCARYPLLTLQDAEGQAWQLGFIETRWPTTPIGLGTAPEIMLPMQGFLATRGWLSDQAVDGRMGAYTVVALARFQALEGLDNTGQFDAATSYRLACHLAAKPARRGAGSRG